jgi:putative ABC transport system substrate-binding protein
MRRREFIAGLILAPLATQSFAAEKRISVLHSGFPERTPIHVLIDALRALGHENGSTAVIEVLGGEGDAGRLDALVNGIAASKPDVTIALTSPAVLALKKAGVTTSVVFAFVTDPVGFGMSRARRSRAVISRALRTARRHWAVRYWICCFMRFWAREKSL